MGAFGDQVGGFQVGGAKGGAGSWDPSIKDMVYDVDIEPIFQNAKCDPDTLENIGDCRKDLAAKIQAYLDGPMTSPLLVRTTPGLGKSEVGIQSAISVAKKGIIPFYAVPTRNMALQIHQRIKDGAYGYGVKVINLEGRHDGYIGVIKNHKTGNIDEIHIDPNCPNYHRVQKAAARGYFPGNAVCPSCPFWPHGKDDGQKVGFKGACRYYQTIYRAAGFTSTQNQGNNWAPIILMTHQKLASIVAESEGDSPLKPGMVIIDEDWSVALRDTVSWSGKELLRQVKCDQAIVDLRKLMVRSIEIADDYKNQIEHPTSYAAVKNKDTNADALRKGIEDSRVYGSYAVWGRRLVMLMREAASQLEMDLGQTLMDASVASTGVGAGDYMSMTDARDSVVPHHKEPELAQELKTVLDGEVLGKETCYKVSLRCNESGTWELCWDGVRRLNYGGPVIMLDAYGDPEIVKRLCNDREPEVVTVKAKSRSNVHVHQYICSTSRATMDTQFNDIFDRYADPYLRDMAGKSVLFYGMKRYEGLFRQRIKDGKYGLSRYAIKWFWQDRGDDSYKDYDALIALGTPLSNVVAERHFANAVFYGEEPLDWSTDKKHKHLDQRVRKHLQARQEKEYQQACFRLRPASDAKDQEQTIIIVSRMELDLHKTFPGAQITIHKHPPNLSRRKMSESFHKLFKYFKGWTSVFSSFMGIEQRIISWFEAGGVKSGRDFPIKYADLMERFKKWVNSETHHGFRGILGMMSGEPKKTKYNGKEISVSGDVERVLWGLEQIRLATREPGVDDDDAPGQNPYEPYDPMEDMDEISLKAIDMAIDEIGDPNDSLAIAKAGNEIYVHLKAEQDALEKQQGQQKKHVSEPALVNVLGKAAVGSKPKIETPPKTDGYLMDVAGRVVAAEFEDKGMKHLVGKIEFFMAAQALFEEFQAERDFRDMFDEAKKDPSVGEVPIDPPDD